MKICRVCKEEKPLEEFVKDKRNSDGRGARCKICYNLWVKSHPNRDKYLESQRERNKERYKNNKEAIIARTVQWGRENPEKRRKYTIKSRYGISIEEYDALKKKQDNKCAICGETNSNGWELSVDHDHKCCPGPKSCGKCVRGLLCFKCNSGLGNFTDSEEKLSAALTYLQSNRSDNEKVH